MNEPAILAVWIDRHHVRHVERITECLCTSAVRCLSHRRLGLVFRESVAMVLVPLKSGPFLVDNYGRRDGPADGGGAA